jgi:hypothetical protein
MYCIICGNEISYKVNIQIKYAISKDKYTLHAPVCLDQKCIDDYKMHMQYPTHEFNGYCKICGKRAELIISGHGEYKNTRYHHKKCKTTREKQTYKIILKDTNMHIHRHPLKPWKDPNSLFCSPRLNEIIGKEPRKGKECK